MLTMTETTGDNAADGGETGNGNNKRTRLEADLGETLTTAEKRETIRRYLQAFSKDQLTNLLIELGTNQQEAYAEIVRMACNDLVNRKLFVRGINWNTTNESLEAAFAEFGEVEEATIVTDKATGKSKGFGFVNFRSGEAAFAALARRTLMIDGRTVQYNLASLRNDQPALGIGPGGNLAFAPSAHGGHTGGGSHHAHSYSGGHGSDGNDVTLRKLFVRGLNWETNNDGLRQAFEVYGPVEEAAVVMDKIHGRSKGFGFVTFATAASASKALEQPSKEIQGRVVSCNLACEGAANKGGGGGMSQQGYGRPVGAGYGGVSSMDPSPFAQAGAQAAFNAYQGYGVQQQQQPQAAGFGAGFSQQAGYGAGVAQQAFYGAGQLGVQGAASAGAATQQQPLAGYGAAYGYANAIRK